MSRLIEPGDGDAIDLDEFTAFIAEQRIDPGDDDGFATIGPMLARLARNQSFVGDAAIAALSKGSDNAGYDAQVLALAKIGDRYLLRAGFWPAPGDAAYAESGPDAFCYGLAHDHDFSFLTCGYWGPGYLSDEWEVDAPVVPDMPAGLRSRGRSRLTPGRVVLYRAHRDVHSQRPPEQFSVSLNLIDRALPTDRREQYRFDPANDRVAGAMAVDPAHIMLELAARLDGDDGIDMAVRFARSHRCERMRMTALSTLAVVALATLPPLLDRAMESASGMLARHARRIATELDGVRGDEAQ